ncbi:MAG: DNA repair protein RadA, partial [Pseudomonadota bacterium]
CGATYLQWQGQCGSCQAWNSLRELTQTRSKSPDAGSPVKPVKLAELRRQQTPRQATGSGELDRVLGGGVVPGSVVLIGGDPGIGKSTLLLQASATMSEKRRVVYVSGEESLQQVGLRADRVGADANEIEFVAETCVERLLPILTHIEPDMVVVDSIQTIYSDAVQSAPGAVSQLRESTAQLVNFAKSRASAVLLVGHVTKEGHIAGPRVLEHMVDTVLYFENDTGSRFRIIRAIKNRFGAANEIGVFAMSESGLKEVRNPSALFVSQHPKPVAGSLVMVTWEGSRPMLVEVQALVSESAGSAPRRVASGVEQNRLNLLLAVLHRHGGVPMFNQDVFLNIVGGMKIAETAVDLPTVLASLSSFRDRPISNKTVAFGEVGLAGEIRPVPFGEERIRQAATQGYTKALVPVGNKPKQRIPDIEVIPLERLDQALDAAGL